MIALSWSRLSDYMQCPWMFNLKYISKSFPQGEQDNIHFVKGRKMHKQMEDYVLAKRGDAPMPLGFSPEIKEALPYVDKLFTLFNGQVFPEAQVAATKQWQPIDWFGGKDVAWRAILDCTAIGETRVATADWKTGKIYPYTDGFGQLHLSAVMALERYPHVESVTSAYVYLEHKVVKPVKVTRNPTNEVDANGKLVIHLEPVRTYFEQRFEQVQMEKKWDPTPNDNCKYCQATRGQCKYSRKL